MLAVLVWWAIFFSPLAFLRSDVQYGLKVVTDELFGYARAQKIRATMKSVGLVAYGLFLGIFLLAGVLFIVDNVADFIVYNVVRTCSATEPAVGMHIPWILFAFSVVSPKGTFLVIVDTSGVTLAEIRMTGAKFLSRKSAMAKAVTAASIGAP